MTNKEFKERQEAIKRLADKANTEIDADDIVDFWGEITNAMISKNYRTGEVKHEDAYDFEIFDSIESAAEAGIITILEWAMDGDEEAVNWLLENGVDIDDEMNELTEEEQKLVGEFDGFGWIRKEDGEWIIEDAESKVCFDTKEEMLKELRSRVDSMAKEEPTIESVEPEYTGGGIYIFTGKLTNGNYFLATNDYDVRVLDSPYDWDSEFFDEWQEAHLVKDLEPSAALQFCKQMVDWVKANEPNANYSMYDMRAIAEDIEECLKAEAEGKDWR